MNQVKWTKCIFLFLSAITVTAAFGQKVKTIELCRLPLNRIEIGVVTSKSNTNYYGGPIAMGGKTFSTGIGIRAAVSALFMDLKGQAKHFSAWIGHDDAGIKIPV